MKRNSSKFSNYVSSETDESENGEIEEQIDTDIDSSSEVDSENV